MIITETIREICRMGNLPSKQLSKPAMAAKLLTLQAELEKNPEIPLEVFEAMDSETRTVALQGFILIAIQTLNE